MKQTKITINNGKVFVPNKVSMRSFEIADLFGVYIQTINAHIKAILKSDVISPDTSGTGIISGNTVIPLDFGLDMITALAFRIHSPKAKLFREWIMSRITAKKEPKPMAVYIPLPDGSLPN